MKFTKIILFLCIIGVVFIKAGTDIYEGTQVNWVSRVNKESAKPTLQVIDTRSFINEDNFYQTIAHQSTYNFLGQVVGGILPHHDVAAYMMADFYKSISEVCQPEVIFLIGPNHYRIGERCQVGMFNFDSYAGTLSSDEEIVMQLTQDPNIYQGNYEVFNNEHSLNIHMNYICYYFEDVTVVPIILKETNNQEDLLAIAEKIRQVSKDKNVFYMASVDFSHYLTLEEANSKDEETRHLLANMNTDQLMSLNDDHLDCPSAITLLLKILKDNELTCKVYDHNNSAMIMKQLEMKETTSYFSVIYSTKEENGE